MFQTVCVVRPTSVLPKENWKFQAGLGNAIAFLCTISSSAAVGKKVAVGFTYFTCGDGSQASTRMPSLKLVFAPSNISNLHSDV